MKSFIFYSLSFCISLFFCLVAAEGILRFFPVEDSPFTESVTLQAPLAHAPPNSSYRFSKGWSFENAQTGRYNNIGFRSNFDYNKNANRPLLGVIGDSYIEAKMMPFEQTIQGRLHQVLSPKGMDVYNFALSGAPLSQYLAWADYAKNTYQPDALIISVVSNDFDESLYDYRLRDGFYHFRNNENTDTLDWQLSPYEPSFLRRLALNSSFMRYLVFHLNIRQTLSQFTQEGNAKSEAPQSLPTQGIKQPLKTEREKQSERAITTFFDRLPAASGLAPQKIFFILDGDRTEFPAPTPPMHYHQRMRLHFMTEARKRGYAFLDLHPIFQKEYAQSQKPFHTSLDYHWNGYAHGIIHKAITQTAWYKTHVLSLLKQ